MNQDAKACQRKLPFCERCTRVFGSAICMFTLFAPAAVLEQGRQQPALSVCLVALAIASLLAALFTLMVTLILPVAGLEVFRKRPRMRISAGHTSNARRVL